jgi:hypothetical protein
VKVGLRRGRRVLHSGVVTGVSLSDSRYCDSHYHHRV